MKLKTIFGWVISPVVGSIVTCFLNFCVGKWVGLDRYAPLLYLCLLVGFLAKISVAYVFYYLWVEKERIAAKVSACLGVLLTTTFILSAGIIIVMAMSGHTITERLASTARHLTSSAHWLFLLILLLFALVFSFFPLLWHCVPCILRRLIKVNERIKSRFDEDDENKEARLWKELEELEIKQTSKAEKKSSRKVTLELHQNEDASPVITPMLEENTPNDASMSPAQDEPESEGRDDYQKIKETTVDIVSRKQRISLLRRYQCPHCNREYDRRGRCESCPNAPTLELRKNVLALQILSGVAIAVVFLIFVVLGVILIYQMINGR